MSNWENESVFVSGYLPLESNTGGGGRVEQQQQPGVAMTPEWRRWVAENVLLRNEPNSIVDAMVKGGVDRPTAIREVQAALDHPYLRAAKQLGKGAGGNAGNLEVKLTKRDW